MKKSQAQGSTDCMLLLFQVQNQEKLVYYQELGEYYFLIWVLVAQGCSVHETNSLHFCCSIAMSCPTHYTSAYYACMHPQLLSHV